MKRIKHTTIAEVKEGGNIKAEAEKQYNMTMALYKKLNIEYKGAEWIEEGKKEKLFFEIDG